MEHNVVGSCALAMDVIRKHGYEFSIASKGQISFLKKRNICNQSQEKVISTLVSYVRDYMEFEKQNPYDELQVCRMVTFHVACYIVASEYKYSFENIYKAVFTQYFEDLEDGF